MKQNVKKMAIVVVVVGLLALALGATGCIETKMTATWLSTGASSNPGGLTVSGKLSAKLPDSDVYVPLPGAKLTLDGTNDANTWVTIATGTTTTTGTYALGPIPKSDDKYLLYRVNYDGKTPDPFPPFPSDESFQAQGAVVGWFTGINYGLDALAQNVSKVPAGTFPDHGSGILAQLKTVKTMANKPSQYKSAANVMNAVLKQMDKANATAGGTNEPLLYADFWTYVLAKDFGLLAGEPWPLTSTRAIPDGFLGIEA